MCMFLTTDREHVVDILPNVWVLDNRLVTGIQYIPYSRIDYCVFMLCVCLFVASERRQVAQFFLKSETSPQPVVSHTLSSHTHTHTHTVTVCTLIHTHTHTHTLTHPVEKGDRESVCPDLHEGPSCEWSVWRESKTPTLQLVE